MCSNEYKHTPGMFLLLFFFLTLLTDLTEIFESIDCGLTPKSNNILKRKCLKICGLLTFFQQKYQNIVY